MRRNCTLFKTTSMCLSTLAVMTFAQACGDKKDIDSKASSSEDATAENGRDAIQVPPQEYYDQLLEDNLARLDNPDSFALAGATQVLWLNFNGATIQKGYRRGQSFILCSQSATIAPSGHSPADQDSIVQKVQAYYDAAGAAVTVTTEKPQSGDFTTMIVGGSYGTLGCLESRGTLGVAPLDGGNANRNDIGFAFTKFYNSVNTVAETISHEAGHSFGLDHTINNKDIMYASLSPQQEGFGVGRVSGGTRIQDGPKTLQANLGIKGATSPYVPNPGPSVAPAPSTAPSASPAPIAGVPAIPGIPGLPNLPGGLAGLPGLPQIATIANLIPQLAPGNILDITNLLPIITKIIPGNAGSQLPGLDKVMTILGIAQGAVNNPAAVAPNQPGQPAQSQPSLPAIPGMPAGVTNAVQGGVAAVLNPSTLTTVGTLATLAGHPEIAIATSVLQGVVSSGALPAVSPTAQGSAPLQTPTAARLDALPDFASALALGNMNSFGGLMAMLRGQVAVINSNFTGNTRAALLSTLKLAYAQAYYQNIRSVSAP